MNESILIIDDEEAIRQSFSDYLEDRGFLTFTAENGRVGVEMFDRENADLVLVDLRMPEMNGLDVLTHIKGKSPDTPLIVVSGAGLIDDALAALHQGAWDYLVKPVQDMSVLAHAVDMALEKARLRRENRQYQQRLEQMVADRTKALEEANAHLRKSDKKSKQLNRLMEKLLAPDTLQNKMGIVTDGVVEIFDAALSRIWITMPGDQCDSGCYHAQTSEGESACRFRDKCLHLIASSGCHTHTNGQVHGRLPFEKNKVGRIASGSETEILNNDIARDPQIKDPNWAADLGLTSFAGYRLLSEGDSPVGVLALFSRNPISTMDNTLLEGLSNSVAHVIQTAKAEEALHESERNLSSMMANTQDGVIRIDKRFRNIFANSAIYDSIGLSPEQYLGKTNEEIGAPEDVAAIFRSNYKRVFDTGEPATFEIRYPTANKGERAFQAVVAPEYDEDKEVETIVSFMRDITDLKRAEQALKESEALLDATGKVARVGGWELDTKTFERKWTKQTYRIFEFPLDYKPDDKIRDHIHPDDRKIIDAAAQLAFDEGEPFDLEHRVTTAKGNDLWIRSICIPQIVDGKVVKLKGTFQDISELKHAEHALRESEALLDAAGKMAKVGGWEVDANTFELKWTKQIHRILELPLDYKPVFKDAIRFFHPDDQQMASNFLQRALDQGESIDVEFRLITAKGNLIWTRAIVDSEITDGRVVRLKGTFQDISELKQVEQALRESERRYRSVIELSPLGFAIKNAEGVIIDSNQALASMVGYEIEELLGSDFSGITHPDDYVRERELFQSLVNGEKKSFSMEKRYKHKNGKYFWINLTVAKLPGLAGNETFGFVEDIRNRKKMEMEREKLIHELQAALAEIKELRGFLPICSSCKKIRDDAGYWQQVETYITERTDAKFPHGICPDCAKRLYPDIYERVLEKKKSES